MKERRYTTSIFYTRSDYHVRMSKPALDAYTVLMAGVGVVALIAGPITGAYSVGIGFAGLAGALLVALFPRLDYVTVALLLLGIMGLVIGPVVDFYSWSVGGVLLVAALVVAVSWRVYLVGNRSRYYAEPAEYWFWKSNDSPK